MSLRGTYQFSRAARATLGERARARKKGPAEPAETDEATDMSQQKTNGQPSAKPDQEIQSVHEEIGRLKEALARAGRQSAAPARDAPRDHAQVRSRGT